MLSCALACTIKRAWFSLTAVCRARLPLIGGTIGLALDGCQSSVMEERGATPACPVNLRCVYSVTAFEVLVPRSALTEREAV